MASTTSAEIPGLRSGQSRRDTAVLVAIAAAVALVHLATNSRYGFHRDELQFLSDALHLDWGFVAYPPFTPVVERLALMLFGHSLVGLRFFSMLAQAVALVVTGLMARELGGGRVAQVTAAVAIAFSPLPLFEGTEFQYTTFDYLWWVLIAYFVIRLLKSEDPRWWLAIGAAIGLGLETKYSITFYVAGIVGGLALSQARRYLWSKWFWAGVGLALLIFLPNLLWQVRHGFISYHFLQHIHARDVGEGRADGFLKDQFWICMNLFAAPLALAGVIFFLRDRRYRMLGWMFVITLALFGFAKGRGYYTAGLYPMVIAMGAVAGEHWVSTLRTLWRRVVESLYFTGLAVCGMFVCALILPLATSGPLKEFALKNNGDLREQFGWNQLVQTVAGIRDSLPAEQRDNVGVMVGNYGEGGAIEILGPGYHLPPPISMTNSAWLRGYPVPSPSTLIVVGFSRENADEAFTSCRLAGHNSNVEGVKNEESKYHPDIFVCGGPKLGWAQFWRENQRYG